MPPALRPRPRFSSTPPPIDEVRNGDAAGEYLFMRRGGLRAWAYVAVSFIFEICWLSMMVFELLKRTKAGHDSPNLTVLIAVAAGIALSVWVYNDRWRCIEAFSSRFCFGTGYAALITTHLCMAWVPSFAFAYANYRGLRKLLGS